MILLDQLHNTDRKHLVNSKRLIACGYCSYRICTPPIVAIGISSKLIISEVTYSWGMAGCSLSHHKPLARDCRQKAGLADPDGRSNRDQFEVEVVHFNGDDHGVAP